MNKRKIKKIAYRLRNLPTGLNFFKYSSNKGLYIYHKLLKTNQVAYPSTMMVELSAQCNLHCSICARESGYGQAMEKGYAQIDQVKKLLDEVLPYLDSIGLTGMGETYLYKDLPDVVDYIKQRNKGAIISLSTNAMPANTIEMTQKMASKIDTIQISIDGIGEVYNSIRKGSDYDKFIANVRQMIAITRNTKTDLMFNMVVTKENYTQMADVISLANQLGVKYVNFNSFNLAAATDVEDNYYDFYHTAQFLKEMSKANEEAAKHKNLEFSSWDMNQATGFHSCPFPWTHFAVTWNGELVPCCAKPFPKELSFGNVFQDGMLATLNNPAFINWRQLWRNNFTPEFCKRCHFIDLKPQKTE